MAAINARFGCWIPFGSIETQYGLLKNDNLRGRNKKKVNCCLFLCAEHERSIRIIFKKNRTMLVKEKEVIHLISWHEIREISCCAFGWSATIYERILVYAYVGTLNMPVKLAVSRIFCVASIIRAKWFWEYANVALIVLVLSLARVVLAISLCRSRALYWLRVPCTWVCVCVCLLSSWIQKRIKIPCVNAPFVFVPEVFFLWKLFIWIRYFIVLTHNKQAGVQTTHRYHYIIIK